jgi:pimeloyl-ACP methyl ester carboxylesterase
VTLYFQESYWTAAGQRTFNVSINGATVLSAFDIFAAAGGTNRAIARTFTTTANASGQVVIAFTRGGGPDNPKVEGIAVTGASVVPTSTPTPTPTTGTRPSAGCGKTRTLQNGTHTIQSGGVNRTYILNVPSTYNNTTPYRLVIGYPWGNGTAVNVANGGYYGLLPRSNGTTIFIAPQGIDNAWANPNGRDVTFTDAFLSQVWNDLCVDQSRIFATGFSYGGAMSYAIACSRPNVFRAVVVIAGGSFSGCSGGTSPVAYLGIHGVSDNIANISGGRAARDNFLRNNGYPAQNAPEPAVGSRTHICTKYQGGMAAYPVEWCAFDGGHQASPFDGGSGDDGSRSWVPGETWAFFTQF